MYQVKVFTLFKQLNEDYEFFLNRVYLILAVLEFAM